jgi:cytochrome c-type protein NapC
MMIARIKKLFIWLWAVLTTPAGTLSLAFLQELMPVLNTL